MPAIESEHEWSGALRVFAGKLKRLKPHERIMDEYSGPDAFENFVLIESAESWEDFLRWLSVLKGRWCFRGQREAVWSLTTSLDRAVFRHKSSENSASTYHLDRTCEELDLLFRFRQQAHQYLTHLPDLDDRTSWLAVMQHYGVPTRFMDWTTSPYVGMYFALEERPVREEKRSALWAIDLEWLEEKTKPLLRSDIYSDYRNNPIAKANVVADLLSSECQQPFVVTVNPRIGNERLSAQQALFLCKLYHEAPFYGVLMSMILNPDLTDRPIIRKLELPVERRIEFLKHLRTMNIHRFSLFPGLDGFGHFLRLDLEMKDND